MTSKLGADFIDVIIMWTAEGSLFCKLRPELDLLLAASHTAGYLALEFSVVLPPLLGGVHIGGGLVVRIGQHGDNREEDRLHGVHRQPALLGLFIAPLVIPRLVEDRDAHVAGLVDIRMPDLSDELHARRTQRILLGEDEVGLEAATFVEGVRGPDDHNLPLEDIGIADQAGGEALDGIAL